MLHCSDCRKGFSVESLHANGYSDYQCHRCWSRDVGQRVLIGWRVAPGALASRCRRCPAR